MSFLTAAPVQHCGPHSAVLPWAVAAVSLIVNVIFTICVMVLRWVITASLFDLKSPSVQQRVKDNIIMCHSFFSPKEQEKKGETKPRGQNIHVIAENRAFTRVWCYWSTKKLTSVSFHWVQLIRMTFILFWHFAELFEFNS